MKRICFVNNTCKYIYLFRRNLMARLLRDGWDVYFLTTPDGYEKLLIEKGFKFIPLYFDRKGMGVISNLKLIFDLTRIYKKYKFDIVMHYTIKPNIYGSIAAAMSGAKSINTMTGLGYIFMRDDLVFKLVKAMYRFAFIFPAKVVFQNPDDRQLFLKNKLVREDRTILVPGSGVDIDYFSPAQEPQEAGQKIAFLFAGRFLWDKGIRELIEAFKQVKKSYPRSELRMLGMIDKGNPTGVLEETIRSWERDGIVKYLGETEDVRPFITQSQVAVYPSYSEGVPRFLLEVMAMGKPIITTDAVGCREVIKDGKNGFMVKAKDVDSLAAAMKRMIELPEQERLQMGRRGREKAVSEFDEQKVIQIYVDTIKEIYV